MPNPYAMQDALEAEREAQAEAYVAWCEANDLDPDAEATSAAYSAWCQEQEDARW